VTPPIFEQLLAALQRGPLPLSQLHAYARDAGSAWSNEQVRLMLECLDGVTIGADQADPAVSLGQRSARDELAQAILELVRANEGRPVPPQEVLRRLLGRFTTSVEQIMAIARQTPGLEVFGPGLLRPRS
jgi:hypothetical protein